MRRRSILLAIVLAASACGDSEQTSIAIATSTTITPQNTTQEQDDVIRFPTILDASLSQNSDGTWSLAVTLSSTYDTPARYTDGWRVLDEQGNIIGDRPLAHDHQGEQPFTRSTSGIVIPKGTTILTIEARDQQYGWSPDTFTVEVPAS